MRREVDVLRSRRGRRGREPVVRNVEAQLVGRLIGTGVHAGRVIEGYAAMFTSHWQACWTIQGDRGALFVHGVRTRIVPRATRIEMYHVCVSV